MFIDKDGRWFENEDLEAMSPKSINEMYSKMKEDMIKELKHLYDLQEDKPYVSNVSLDDVLSVVKSFMPGVKEKPIKEVDKEVITDGIPLVQIIDNMTLEELKAKMNEILGGEK